MVLGQNGTGKTNLLEAVYVAMHGRSFRVADKDLLNYDSDWFRIDASFAEQTRSVRYQSTPSANKRVAVNDGAKKRFTQAEGLPVVLFEPDMLRALSGSPARRRKLLDELIVQWFEDGATTLRRYERVLLQRNKILKDAWDLPPEALDDKLFAWDVSFAELANKIETYRALTVAKIQDSISKSYSRIAKKPHHIEITYDGDNKDKQSILRALQQARRQEAARGYTLGGPHRSDFSIRLDGQPINSTASRGEQRSLVLAIKEVEAAELTRLYETPPILLLDDITGELDPMRVKSLLELVAPYQTIATAAHHSPLLRQVAAQTIEL